MAIIEVVITCDLSTNTKTILRITEDKMKKKKAKAIISIISVAIVLAILFSVLSAFTIYSAVDTFIFPFVFPRTKCVANRGRR